MDEQQYVAFGRAAFGSVSGSKIARIKQYAGQCILDVGCGPGLYLERLLSLGYKVAGVDGNSVFIQEAHKFTDQVYQIDLDKQGLSQFSNGSFDTVLMLDVLEHVVDDKKLLNDAARVANRNVLLSVPAQVPEGMKGTQLVFASYVDPTHRRYYSFKSLQNTLQEVGFRNFHIEGVLRFEPILSDIFPKYLKLPLRALNRFLKRVSNPNLLTSVWFVVCWKTNFGDDNT